MKNAVDPLFSGKEHEDHDSVPARITARVNTDSVAQSLAPPSDFPDDQDHRVFSPELGPALDSDCLRHMVFYNEGSAHKPSRSYQTCVSIGKRTISEAYQDIFPQKLKLRGIVLFCNPWSD